MLAKDFLSMSQGVPCSAKPLCGRLLFRPWNDQPSNVKEASPPAFEMECSEVENVSPDVAADMVKLATRMGRCRGPNPEFAQNVKQKFKR